MLHDVMRSILDSLWKKYCDNSKFDVKKCDMLYDAFWMFSLIQNLTISCMILYIIWPFDYAILYKLSGEPCISIFYLENFLNRVTCVEEFLYTAQNWPEYLWFKSN